MRWQGNWIRREPQATENPVTRFPSGGWVPVENKRIAAKRLRGVEKPCNPERKKDFSTHRSCSDF